MFLAVVIGVAAVLRPAIPGQEPNPLLINRGGFLRNAAHHEIPWLPGSREAFESAVGGRKMILLVVGRDSSSFAKHLDERVFADKAAAERVSRLFHPIRIDLDEDPRWEAAILPISQSQLESDSGFNAYIFSRKGELVSWLSSEDSRALPDSDQFFDWVDQAIERIREGELELEEINAEELNIVTNASVKRLPSANGFKRLLISTVGQPEAGRRTLQPWDIRFLAQDGELELAQQTLDLILESPMVDWVWSGVFTASHSSDWMEPEPRQSMAIQADMVVLAARMASFTGRIEYKQLAEMLAEGISENHLSPGVISTSRFDIARVDGRTESWSLSMSRLSTALSVQERQVLINNLNLSLEQSPLMVPWISPFQLRFTKSEQLSPIFDKIRKSWRHRPSESGDDRADIIGLSAARLIEAGLTVNSDRIIAIGRAAVAALESRAVDQAGQIRHSPIQFETQLTDLIGYAEANLWLAMADQDPARLEKALAVLGEINAWHRRLDGRLLLASADPEPMVGDIGPTIPAWFDSDIRSHGGQLAETLIACAALMDDEQLYDLGVHTVVQFGEAANRSARNLGGLMTVVRQIESGQVIVVGGPEAAKLFRIEASTRPGVMVVVSPDPALDGVYRWQKNTGLVRVGPPGPSGDSSAAP